MNRVSVGLPVFNGARFLSRALDSLLAQRGVDLELVICDNASTDETPAIASSYASRDPRVRVQRSDTNLGVERNFARALESASGEYFMWAACDDWWAPDFAARLVAALERNPAAAVAMSAVERVSEAGHPVDLVRYDGAANPERLSPWQLTMLLAGGRPYHLFVYGLFRTAFLRRVFTGFPPVVAADRLLMCRVAMAARFAYVDEVLHRRTVRQASIANRYAGENIGRLWQVRGARWRMAAAAGPYLWRSPVLPPNRRPWVVAVVLRLIKASAGRALADAGLVRRPGL